jgi:hypothetical protein
MMPSDSIVVCQLLKGTDKAILTTVFSPDEELQPISVVASNNMLRKAENRVNHRVCFIILLFSKYDGGTMLSCRIKDRGL